MIRDDLSHNLVHLVRGATPKEALVRFDKILADQALIGSGQDIRGGWHCVCFTETPLAQLARALSLRNVHGIRYYPAGLMVQKDWLFDRGGRPVIYQPESEYSLLPPELQYRHVRYEFRAQRTIDFTWEREWRIQTERLEFTPADVTLVCPNRQWVDRLINAHTARVWEEVWFVAEDDPFMAPTVVERFPWHCVALEDLGVPMPVEVSLESD